MVTPRKKPEDLKKAGRKTKFTPEMLREVTNYCLLGYTDEELAKHFNITVSTLNLWKSKYPLFSASIRAGKHQADAEVVASLRQRALGYSHPDVHISSYEGDITVTPIIKHYPPDTKAATFWLTNRQRGRWSERSELTGADGQPLMPPADPASANELARQVAFILRKGVESKKKE